MNKKLCLLTLILGIGHAHQATAQQSAYVSILPGDDNAAIIRKAANVQPTERQLRWQELEVTGFFHFGINTFTEREWGDGKESPSLFNPTALDAMQWVQAAKAGGIKQVILTAKHHDGFCLWPSKYTEHSVKNSPWKNGQGDVVKEVADACRTTGMGFGVYLSPWDRNAPSYGTEAYNDYFVNQLTELLTNYGRIDEVWFDGANGEGPNGKKQVYDFKRWYALIRKLQPGAVIAVMGPDVRWVGTETGYGRSTEWSVVPANNLDQKTIADLSQQELLIKPSGYGNGEDMGSRDALYHANSLVWYPAETDVSIRPGWFYHKEEDEKVKTPEKLLDIYFNAVGKNGVLLLNIPPDKRGLIQENDVKNLAAWKNNIDQIFSQNLLSAAKIASSNGRRKNALTDDNKNTWWTTKHEDTTATIEIDLGSTQTFNVCRLQEYIRKGQRVENFVLEYLDGSEWKVAATGTTIGYKRILTFPDVSAQQLRLRITSSRMAPMIADFGIFKQTK
ncbi:alpha-L-fucosidase [Chitinophaga sp. 22321]|nr:alpha-L-fucosidase [Chitinophaga hostae]